MPPSMPSDDDDDPQNDFELKIFSTKLDFTRMHTDILSSHFYHCRFVQIHSESNHFVVRAETKCFWD